MPEYRNRESPNVFVSHVESTMHQRTRFAGEDKKLHGTHAAAKIDVLLYEIGTVAICSGPRCSNEIDRVSRHRLRDRRHTNQFLKIDDFLFIW